VATHPRHPVLAQVAEVLVGLDDGGTGYGSGYRIGERLVLTASHVVDGGTVQVRLGGAPTLYPAEPVWRGSADLAILRLTGVPDGPPPHSPVIGLLSADPARLVPVTVTGFPAFSAVVDADGQPVRDSNQIDAQVATHSHVKSGRLELVRHGRQLTTAALWRGVSGAAVFAEDCLVGVVVEAGTRDAALFAVTLPGPADDPGFWTLVRANGGPAGPRPVRRTPAYANRVRQLAADTGELRDRGRELGQLAAFATGTRTEPYRWIVGPPWAGKTALATYFAAHPPEDVDVVAFFVSRSFGEQTRQFQQDVCDQLAALVDEPLRRFSGRADLDTLWERAHDRAATTGRYLVLLVDGLDENDEAPPIAALLPADTGSHGRVLVLSRELPPVPPQVPRTHPLRDERRCPRIPLAPTRYADQLRERATDELVGLLADRDVRPVLGMLAVGGSMAVEELSEVLHRQGAALDAYDVKMVTRTASARVLSAIPDGGTQVFGFAHDELRRTTVEELGTAAVVRYRGVLDAWADEYAARGWPDETPDYLLRRYRGVLAADQDHGRLVALPTPPRIALWQRRTGHDALAVQEISDVLGAVAGADGLRAACVLAMRRYRLIALTADRSYTCPAAVPVAWGRLGDWTRAEYLASHIGPSVQAYAGLAEVAAGAGDLERFLRLLDAARDPARRHPFEWFTARDLALLGRAAGTLGAVDLARDLLHEAETVLRQRADPRETDRRAEALATVAQAYATIGDHGYARQLVAHAERQLDGLPNRGMRAYYLSLIAFASAQVRGAAAAVRSFPPARDPAYEARVYAAFARAAAEAGDPDEAARMLDLAGGRLPALVQQHSVVYGNEELRLREALSALTEVAAAAVRAGDPDRARRCLRHATGSVRLLGYDRSQDKARTQLATVHELLGDSAAATVLIEQITEPDARLAALTAAARAAREANHPGRAGELFAQSSDLALSIDRPRRQQDEPREELVVALAEAGDPARAERILRAMSSTRLPFWETLALTGAVADAGRLDQAQPLLALAGDDTSLRERMVPLLAAGAGRADRLSLVDELVERWADRDERARILRTAAVGAAEASRFETALRLLTRADEVPKTPAPKGVWLGDQDPAVRVALLALAAGSPLVDAFRHLARPHAYENRPAAPAAHAIGGDIEFAVHQVEHSSAPVADAVTALAAVVSAQGQPDLAGQLIDLATRTTLGWRDAADYAISGELSTLAVAASRLGHLDRADPLLDRLTNAHPDHRVPALAARAEAYARAGESGQARDTLADAFGCLLSREGGAGADRAVAACVRAGMAVDTQLCRTELARALATRPDTPRFLAAVPLAEPSLAGLAVALFAGEDPPPGPA
jgi:tetratricopeptide (TPR) repeat protein